MNLSFPQETGHRIVVILKRFRQNSQNLKTLKDDIADLVGDPLLRTLHELEDFVIPHFLSWLY
jgi:hypothetical protein